MGSEAGLRNTLKGKMNSIAHYNRVESSCTAGIPDVELAWKTAHEAWIELKYRDNFPKKPTTKVSFKHFTREQCTWLLSRWAVKPGGSWLFVQVGKEYYLFTGRDAAKVFYGVNTKEFKELAYWTGARGWSGKEFLSVLSSIPIR